MHSPEDKMQVKLRTEVVPVETVMVLGRNSNSV